MTIRPRWKKIYRDIAGERGRTFLMLAAISVGIFGIATILSTYSILIREVQRNYMATNPASATIDVGEVTDAMLATAKNFPGIAEAEARSVSHSRVKVGDDWLRMLIFVVDDFDEIRLNTFRKVSGAWPPPKGTMLVEHTAIQVLKKGEGGAALLKTPHGVPTSVRISGVVHDATLAPAWQEEAGYGYMTRETFSALGEPSGLDELRIQLDGNPESVGLVESRTLELANRLRDLGHDVHEIRVPKPRTHPHQTQMQAIMFLLIVFAGMALLLSAILVATVIAGMLTRQVREIGMMKAVGARSQQIARMYLTMLMALGAASVAIGLPAGILASWLFADRVSNLLNIEIGGYGAPVWVYGVIVVSGLFTPVLVALPTILKGSRLTVHQAIADFGVGANRTFGDSRFDVALGAVRGIGLPYVMALRNMFRRRGRLVLALSLLAAGGGMFISAMNIGAGWKSFADRVFLERHYDVEFSLNDPVEVARIDRALESIPDIRLIEYSGYSPMAVAKKGRIDVARAYPDQVHGASYMLGIDARTELISYPLLSGRWLREGDGDVVVLNQTARLMAGMPKVGDDVRLSRGGVQKAWRLVGVVEKIGPNATAYVPRDAYDAAAGTAGTAQMVRISASANTPEEREKLIQEIDNALLDAGISVKLGLPISLLRTAMGDHVSILIRILVAAAVLLAVIGVLGLTSTMSDQPPLCGPV